MKMYRNLRHLKCFYIKLPVQQLQRQINQQHASLLMVAAQQRLCGGVNADAHSDNKIVPENGDDLELMESLKTALYKEEDQDHLMTQLNKCRSPMELLDVIEQHQPTHQHHAQCVVLLWTIMRRAADTPANTQLPPQPALERLLCNLRPHIATLDLNELSCCYLYLRKLGVPNTHAVLAELLLQALDSIEAADSLPALPALSRMTVGLNTGRDFFVPLVCRNIVPHILSHAEACTTAEQARLLAICLLNLQKLPCVDVMHKLRRRVQQMLAAGTLSAQTPKPLVKLIQMFNMPMWSQRNTSILRDLLHAISPALPTLCANELKTVCRSYEFQLEPAQISPALLAATERQLQRLPTAESLACYLPFAAPRRREALTATFKELVGSATAWAQPNASVSLFMALRSLKISDRHVCDTYWRGVLHDLDTQPADALPLHFLGHCHRYMNFNNNLGGTYRNEPLEQRLSRQAMHAIDADIAGRIPATCARLAAFVLAYGQTPYSSKKFPNLVVSKLISMAQQFSILDCFLISRGLQIAHELRFRYHTPPVINMQLSVIDSVLVSCAEQHLRDSEDIAVGDLNLIVRTLAIRKTLKNSVVYHDALNRYKTLNYAADEHCLNSRLVRDMAFNFNMSNFIIPPALDAMSSYVERQQAHVSGDTAEKLLVCLYNLGYTPSAPTVLNAAANILMRDFEFMSGLSLVQACLALCYFKTIPEELINRVFCVKFIRRVEEEIQMCYSKATYPERVQNLIMQLNRTVCLDSPEANVPWFQQNYLEAQLSKKPAAPSRFGKEVAQLLKAIFKSDAYFRCNHTTPYGYMIDFVIHFDSDKQPLPAPTETAMLDRITKVAILLLKLDSFCENDLTALRGAQSLKMKHLEMMGYKVLHVNEHDWNSKYMNAPGAKANYLKCLLQISS